MCIRDSVQLEVAGADVVIRRWIEIDPVPDEFPKLTCDEIEALIG